ncbi:MAG: phosphodiester glycosidase family protein [Halanaerobium sp.]
MIKLNSFALKIFSFVLLFLIIAAVPVSAEYYQSGLVDFIQGKHQITVPIFSPAGEISLSSEKEAVLMASGSEDFKLEKGKKYSVTQGEVKAKKPEIKSGWGVQIMASSSEESALQFKNQVKIDFEEQVIVKKEGELYKVLAGAFSEREKAEEFQQRLQQEDYNGWVREIELQNGETAPEEKEVKNVVTAQSDNQEIGEGLNLYDADGQKIREAHVFKIKGQFEVNDRKMEGEFQFGPIGNSVLFSYKTDLEEMTAYLLQNSFDEGTPSEALKAQAVLYRTSLLYELENQGARLENINDLDFGRLKPIFKEAAAATKNQVLVRNEEFYYNSDSSLKGLNKPRVGIIPLSEADYDYQEIINYYYERAEMADLTELLDSELKFNARINRGLNFKEIRQMSWFGPRVITVVDYDPAVDGLNLKPVLARGVVPGREDLGDIIRNNSALAGVNGGYFHHSGRPLGILYTEGELVSEPLYKRTALLIDRDQNLSFEQVEWEGELLVEELSRSFNLNGINRSAGSDEVIVFNSYFGGKMPALSEGYYDLVVRSGRILGTEKKQGAETPIPPDGYIIRVGSQRNEMINLIPELKGKNIELNNSFSPDLENNNIQHAVGGGPRLLENGEIKITGEEEKFQPDILNGRAPRTALGITEDNRLLMLTIDGRQSALSIGMTLEETAEILKEMGAVEAMNLDGGASSRMVIRGFTMNSPSGDRLISNGVIVGREQ